MKFNDLLRISTLQVFRHRHRYWGVALVIGLGVAGLITTITMAQEIKKNINLDLDLIGGATIIRGHFDNQKASMPQWFRPETKDALGRLPGVMDISLSIYALGQSKWGKEYYNHTVIGVDDAFWQVRSLSAVNGRLFGAAEVTGHKLSCVLGSRLAQNIFGQQNVYGRFLQINNDIYQVIGVVGGVGDIDLANTAFIPVTTLQDRFPGVLPDHLYLRCRTWDDVAPVAAAIPGVVQARQPEEQLRVVVSWEALKRVQKVSWGIELLIYVAISATLLLAGAGIWNVMMGAVRSRTQEIGLKKAMGAEDRDILAQFLSEALCLSMGAAILGVALGRLLVEITCSLLGSRPPEELFFLALGIGLGFAAVLGVGAGLYPSIQASRMEVVSAIRYE